ncbi:uncharacterized protein LOC18431261 isoform X2 [Amborella trichopoda]|uniref:uncharacterized protein LOC18431261 isoform X2 n=1 Tax=Amborella trichopoda TaxID=13333 RepID=UPI0005D44676|nr:uncharacterized protein LOC18431261 isoform X2 [Amborella trichopoda]|eukprot:XP_011622215.1 uncharacterized protein LOC18431261 isoform X2 [Amborella trichopoda]
MEVVEEDSKDLQQQSKALDKLTDHVEDRQLNSLRVQEAMASIAASAEADWNAMKMREKELAAVKINPADVDIIANELEVNLLFLKGKNSMCTMTFPSML